MLAGLLFAASSLAWPFGWDTSVHYYVGREWLLRGAIPYRDTFDHKPPGIHFVHAACIALMGEGMWPIRVFELACVVVLGACAAALVTHTKRPTPGLTGAAIAMASISYYGFFDFWNTAQAELLGATIGVVMLLVARRVRVERATWLVGAMTGMLLCLKPPFVLLAALPLVLVVQRSERKLRDAVTSVASIALVPAAFVAYFALAGALRPMREILVDWNVAYVHKPCVHSTTDVGHAFGKAFRDFSPVSTLLFVAIGVVGGTCSLRERWRAVAYLLGIGSLVASILVVVVQLKFYWYHWSLGIGPVVVLFTAVARDVQSAFSRRRAAIAFAPLALLVALWQTGMQWVRWRNATLSVAKWVVGIDDRQRFADAFVSWWGPRGYGNAERAGNWLRAHASAGDTVLVRGTATEIYVVSGLHAPSRYFWSGYRWQRPHRLNVAAWAEEDERIVRSHAARFVVVTAWGKDSDNASWFTARGYEIKHRIDTEYIVLERVPNGDGAVASGQ